MSHTDDRPRDRDASRVDETSFRLKTDMEIHVVYPIIPTRQKIRKFIVTKRARVCLRFGGGKGWLGSKEERAWLEKETIVRVIHIFIVGHSGLKVVVAERRHRG